MPRYVLSSVGTSLLTNDAGSLAGLLRETANRTEDELSAEQRQAIDARLLAVADTLAAADVPRQRRLSAELNGLYGLYQGDLGRGRDDLHFLLATDTYQGRAAADLLADRLRAAGVAGVEVVVPAGLSTRSQAAFEGGIRKLIRWCQETLAPCRDARCPVTFNLVGSFKSLQGYLNTIGMFYADEILYIFEDPAASLLRIPRLPVRLDTSVFTRHRTLCALLAEEYTVAVAAFAGWPEALWEETGDGNGWLSTWGQLVWDQASDELLADALLDDLPRLDVTGSFRKDFEARSGNRRERIELNRVLARVAVLLEQSGGDTAPLKRDGALQYDNYAGKHAGIGHFRVNNRGWRATCTSGGGRLLLRRFGPHEINDTP